MHVAYALLITCCEKAEFSIGCVCGYCFSFFFPWHSIHTGLIFYRVFFQYFDWLKTFSQFVPSSRGGEKVQKRRERRRRKQKRQTKSNKKGNSWSVNSCWKTCWKYIVWVGFKRFEKIYETKILLPTLCTYVFIYAYISMLCAYLLIALYLCVHSSRAMNISDGISYVSRDWKSVRAIVSVPLCVRWILSWDQMN